MAEANPVTDKDHEMARRCLQCPVCAYARRKQGGLVYWFVTKVESRFCPHCQAYERVYGRKAHEPPPDGAE
ncbi:MAG: hypothetical protein FJX75_17355 [Armatimonadetes bacterium]|nr:hypothetical protein [Armatimonadota bacterium]